jgi:hypothetical protein
MVQKSESKAQKTSKLVLNQKALKFKENIEMEINLVQSTAAVDGQIVNKTKTLGRSKDAGVKAGARYECIYKNFLRDIRQHYSTSYETFLDEINIQGKRNPSLKYLLFPYFSLQFTLKHFDKLLIQTTLVVTRSERVQFLISLAFSVGCFLLPKYMMKSFEAEIPREYNEDGTECKSTLPISIIKYFNEVQA